MWYDLECSERDPIKYIKNTLDLYFVYNCNLESEMNGFVNADWAGDRRDRKSTLGNILTLYDCVIIWSSKKQARVGLSSSEVEYIALSSTIHQSLYIILANGFMLTL